MPIYEFACQECRRQTAIFVRTVNTRCDPVCEHCGGRRLERLVSRVAYHPSAATRRERAGSPDAPGDDYYQDPGNIGRWAEERMGEMGVEMPDRVKDMIGRAREGEIDPILDKRGLDD